MECHTPGIFHHTSGISHYYPTCGPSYMLLIPSIPLSHHSTRGKSQCYMFWLIVPTNVKIGSQQIVNYRQSQKIARYRHSKQIDSYRHSQEITSYRYSQKIFCYRHSQKITSYRQLKDSPSLQTCRQEEGEMRGLHTSLNMRMMQKNTKEISDEHIWSRHILPPGLLFLTTFSLL